MKHGLVQSESYKGYVLMVPPSRHFYNKIGLTIANTYRFVGYKSSILRHLLDSGSCVVNGTNLLDFTVQIKVSEIMKSGTQEITDMFRGAALSFAGGSVSAVDMMNNVLDGISVMGMIKDQVPEGESGIKPVSRPSRFKYLKDHALGSRIIVDLTMHKGEKSGWIDTEMEQIDLKTLAYFLQAA